MLTFSKVLIHVNEIIGETLHDYLEDLVNVVFNITNGIKHKLIATNGLVADQRIFACKILDQLGLVEQQKINIFIFKLSCSFIAVYASCMGPVSREVWGKINQQVSLIHIIARITEATDEWYHWTLWIRESVLHRIAFVKRGPEGHT